MIILESQNKLLMILSAPFGTVKGVSGSYTLVCWDVEVLTEIINFVEHGPKVHAHEETF